MLALEESDGKMIFEALDLLSNRSRWTQRSDVVGCSGCEAWTPFPETYKFDLRSANSLT
jgi:hypothetical protein